ncbi:MAG: tRNA (adenine-N1)-methyltransferase [Candidatus Nanoarchaeia archaeon]
MKILITKDNQKFFFKGSDIHTKWGYVSKETIQSAKQGEKLLTNKGKELYVIEASFSDLYSKIKRGAQIMLPKDISAIVGVCGINKNSRILDAGSGSGGTACFLGAIAKNVYSYEIREDHAKIAQHNVDYLQLKNVKIKNKDITKKIVEKNLDVIILDMAEPWPAIDNCYKALKPGGFLVNYSPNLTQAKEFVNKLKDNFLYIKTIELIEREWEIEERKLRPKYRMLGHTGFLSFARKI